MTHGHIRILSVDDHQLLLEGLSAIISNEPDMEVISAATDGQEAIEKYLRYRPDVVLMDLQLPGMDGFDAIRGIRRKDPNARIIVLTMYHGAEDIYRAFEAGASAYLLKDAVADNLVGIIRDVHAGKRVMPEGVAARLATRMNESPLTSREEQVIQLIGKGMRNKEIGARLGISEETVQAHLKAIFSKLRVHDRTAALVTAIQRGIVHVD
jgi:two-component system NarL family response regulator